MSVITDYLEWRGDIPFAVAPFNEVDSYVISKIGCPDYTGIVSEGASEMDIGEAVEAYFQQENQGLGILASPEILKALKMLPQLPRYQGLKLSGFRNSTDEVAEKQFSALTVRLTDGIHYVSFRGTDDSIIGWKENFRIAVSETVPAQKDALEYLRWAARSYEGDLMVGGHSKGGNLAFYAASRIEPEVQDRILSVYSFDGPGCSNAFYSHMGYLGIVDRLHHVVPQSSLVGMLLIHPSDYEVVSCPLAGPGAHDGFRWNVTRDGFVRAEGLTLLSRAFNEAIERTLSEMTEEETGKFIDDLFDVICANGIENLTELTEQKATALLGTVLRLRTEPNVRAFCREVTEITLQEIRKGVRPDRKRRILPD